MNPIHAHQIISDHLANLPKCSQLVAWLLPRLYAYSSALDS
jgi:hypothetical protein